MPKKRFSPKQIVTLLRQIEITRALGNAMQGAAQAACKNPEVEQFCSRLFANKLRVFVQLEVVTALLRDIELKQRDIDQALHRYPRYAGAISQAWSHAMREVAELFTGASPHIQPSKPTMNTNKANDFEPSARAA